MCEHTAKLDQFKPVSLIFVNSYVIVCDYVCSCEDRLSIHNIIITNELNPAMLVT